MCNQVDHPQLNKKKQRALSPEVKVALKKLARPSLQRFVFALVVDWSVIALALMFSACLPCWPVYLLSIMIIGVQMHALGVLGHEASHYCATRNRQLNDAIGMFCCIWPLGGSLIGYRKFHQLHHRHLGTEKDPERHFFQAPEWKIPVQPGRPIIRFIQNCFGVNLKDYALMIRGMLPQTGVELIGIPVWWAGLATILWSLGHLWLILIYAAAIPTVFWALIELRGWTEHRGIAETHRYQTNWLFRLVLFPHNVWMHHEHHRWCYIPFYNLPAARSLDSSIPVVELNEVFSFLGNSDHQLYAEKNGYTLTKDHFHPGGSTGRENPGNSATAKEKKPGNLQQFPV